MKRKIKLSLVAVYGILFITNLFLLFLTTGQLEGNGAFKGKMIPWVIAITMGLLSLGFLLPWKKIKAPNPKLSIIFYTLVIINILMAVFSLLDIVGTKNYAVSSVMFIAVPISTLLTYGLTLK